VSLFKTEIATTAKTHWKQGHMAILNPLMNVI